jgi:DNA-3-methyladenine glycosylase II
MPKPLTVRSLVRAAKLLAATDADLAWILQTFGPPPLWERATGFPTLVHIILEQQVSLASARAAFDRLRRSITPVTPENFLTLSDTELKTIGFSRQKTLYCRLLAEAIGSGELDLEELRAMKDHQARAALTRLKGIGDWTVDIYLLMALLRPDVWPKGDLALAVAAQRLKKMKTRPTPDELELMAENWRPHRAVAARMLWHFYLSEKEAQNIRTG